MIYLTLGGIFLTVGDIVFKFWLKELQVSMYFVGLLLYMFGLMCLVQSFKTHNIAVASAIFVIINISTLAVVSWFVFSEPLTTKQIIGLALSFIVVMILE